MLFKDRILGNGEEDEKKIERDYLEIDEEKKYT